MIFDFFFTFLHTYIRTYIFFQASKSAADRAGYKTSVFLGTVALYLRVAEPNPGSGVFELFLDRSLVVVAPSTEDAKVVATSVLCRRVDNVPHFLRPRRGHDL